MLVSAFAHSHDPPACLTTFLDAAGFCFLVSDFVDDVTPRTREESFCVRIATRNSPTVALWVHTRRESTATASKTISAGFAPKASGPRRS